MDAGLLDTDTPLGVIITGDEARHFCPQTGLCRDGIEPARPAGGAAINGAWFVKLLENGINVVTASDGGLVFPAAHVDQAYVARLEAAARKGNVTFYMNGQEPGFVEHMAMLGATLSNTIKRVTSFELFDYSTVKERAEMALIFGFDEPVDKTARPANAGLQLVLLGQPGHECRG